MPSLTTKLGRSIVSAVTGPRSRRVVTTGRAAVVGGVAAGAAALLSRRRSAGSSTGDAPPLPTDGPSPAPPVANYDTAGPPTDVPAPVIEGSAEPLGIDEEAEVEAAAAEAASIGGPGAGTIVAAQTRADETVGTGAGGGDGTPNPATSPDEGPRADEAR